MESSRSDFKTHLEPHHAHLIICGLSQTALPDPPFSSLAHAVSARRALPLPMKLHLLNLYWRITRTYLRLRGAEVGRMVRCNGFPYIKIRTGGRLIIEDGVNINASRWSNAHIVAGSTTFYVGENATLRLSQGVGISGTRVVAIKHIEIGAHTLIGAGCLICDSDMHEIPLGSENPVHCEPIHIGNRVFFGAQCVILKGINIGDGAVIAAGSMVSKSVPARCLAAGNPAKVCKEYRA